jgi:uncharacterized protein (TIGR02646 family)
MKKLERAADVDAKVLAALAKVTDKPAEWIRQTNVVKEFKSTTMKHGMAIQDGKCVWCTLAMGEKGHRTAHRDHIAPKKLYPEWTFVPLNIAIACEYCNGFSVKVDLDTVAVNAATYDTVEFYLVHPYLDDPAEHFAFAYGPNGKAGVLISSDTTKGKWTIRNLHLDSDALTIERAKDALYAEHG